MPERGQMPAALGLPDPIGEVAEDYGAVGKGLGVVREEPPEPRRDGRPARLAQGHDYDSAMLRMHQWNGMVEISVRREEDCSQVLRGIEDRFVAGAACTGFGKWNGLVAAGLDDGGGGMGEVLVEEKPHGAATGSP